MNYIILRGILIPFIGTSLGAACVFFMKKDLNLMIRRALTGFAAGVMTAASVWSLLIPAMEQSSKMGRLAFIPAAVGFLTGIFFLLGLDRVIPHLHMNSDKPEGRKSSLKRTTMLVLAVTLHNIPEGMAVGVVYAGCAAYHKVRRLVKLILPSDNFTPFNASSKSLRISAKFSDVILIILLIRLVLSFLFL